MLHVVAAYVLHACRFDRQLECQKHVVCIGGRQQASAATFG